MNLGNWRAQYASDIDGENSGLLEALDMIKNVATSACSVLISGESGTGKELLARALHDASPRAAFPFVAINCAAIPETMIESELFGHVRGAFTGAHTSRAGKFATASGGTLFLDEIGEMPAAAQAKLLRVIQENTICPVGSDDEILVNVRIVAATHRNLEELAAAGTFREDLYYRLNVIPVALPALRERPEDIDCLAAKFLARANATHQCSVKGFSAQAARALRTQPWRGNVRELLHTIERAVLIKRTGLLELIDLGLRARRPRIATEVPVDDNLDLRDALSNVERTLIGRALDKTGGNRTEAAALLGLNRTTLVEKLRKYAAA